MITVTRRLPTLVGAGAVLAGVLLAGCGSNSVSIPTSSQAPTLAAPPSSIPADYTSLTDLLAQLDGVASCTSFGPMSALCSLTVTTQNTTQISLIRPFQVKVFSTTQAATAYVQLIQQTNKTRASSDTALRAALVGPHWVVIPQTTTSDLMGTLKAYLGGTVIDG